MTFEEFLRIASRDPDARSLYEILEDHPEYLNKKDSRGRTAVFYAAESGHGDVVRTLIEYHGADIFVQDKEGKTLADILQENEDTRYLIDEVLRPIAAKKGKDLAALDIARPNLPEDVMSVVAKNLTGMKGSVDQQRRSIRRAVGKGRKQKRKTRKQKKSRR